MTSILEVLRANSSSPSSRQNKLSLAHLINTNINPTTKKFSHTSGIFPDFYGSYDYNTDNNSSAFQLFGLFPSDYDGGLVPSSNESVSLSYKSETQSKSTQLSAPLFYILFMLGLYLVIIFTTFMSALYSHRKRVGYNYDDDYSTLSEDSSDERQLLEPENKQHTENIEMLESSQEIIESFSQGSEFYKVIDDIDATNFANFYTQPVKPKPRKNQLLESSKLIVNLIIK